MGISDDFDPQKRGYNVSRQKNDYNSTSGRNHCLSREDAKQYKDRENEVGAHSEVSSNNNRTRRKKDIREYRGKEHRSLSSSRSGSRRSTDDRVHHRKDQESRGQCSSGYASLGTPRGAPQLHGHVQARVSRETKGIDPLPPEITYIPPPNGLGLSNSPVIKQCLLLLCGLPCSGKTTFARALVAGKPWKFERVSSAQLCCDKSSRSDNNIAFSNCNRNGYYPHSCDAQTKNKHNADSCVEECQRVLKDGKCPILDMCNTNPEERKPFLDLARKNGDIAVDCIVFSCGVEVCIRRCEGRNQCVLLRSSEDKKRDWMRGKKGDIASDVFWPGEEREAVISMARKFFPPLPTRVNSEEFRTLRNVKDLYASNDAVLEYLNDPY